MQERSVAATHPLCLLLAAVSLTACGDTSGPEVTSSFGPENSIRSEFARRGPKSFIVTLEPKASPVQVAQDHGIAPEHVYTVALNGFSGRIPDVARSGLLRDYRVRRIEEDVPVYADATEQAGATWGLDRIDQRELPLNGSYVYDSGGDGVTVYVFDTGIRFDHAEFEGRAKRGYDGIGDGRNGADCNGHGTHVAGTIGGRTYGVAKRISLVAVRVIGCTGSGSVGAALAGIEWVIRNHGGPAVANFSLTTGHSSTLNDAVGNLIASGVAVVAAAGNSGSDACLQSPASAPGAVTTGAAGATFVDGVLTDSRLSFSNWGSCVDVFAPGTGIMSALIGSPTDAGTKSGTSMAAPHVAGTMALWLAQDPALTPSQLHDLVIDNATHDVVADARSANAHLLFSRLPGHPDGDGGDTEPHAAFSVSCAGRTCTFDASASYATDTDIVGYDWQFGDGATDNGMSASHTYAGDGSYTVALTVTDGRGATATSKSSISVSAGNQSPAASFEASCTNLTCSFTDRSSDADGSIAARAWNFGDGNTSSASNPTHAFGEAGTYDVTLQVTDDAGATATTALEVTVSDATPPVADFTFSCTGAACQFNDASVQSTSGIRSWRWSFGDGMGSEEQNPVHTYASAGNYEVRLDVTDEEGATASTTRTVSIDASRSIPLIATPYKVKGRHSIDLAWSGAAGANVILYRDGSVLLTVPNTGSFTDHTDNKGRTRYSYRICEEDGSLCSAEVTLEFR